MGKVVIGIIAVGLIAFAFSVLDRGNDGYQTVAAEGTQIVMMNPQGFPERDQQNADTNLTNSEANKNNAEGYAVITEADANATKTAAEACDIRNDCGLYNYKDGYGEGKQEGASSALSKVVIGILVLILGILLLARR